MCFLSIHLGDVMPNFSIQPMVSIKLSNSDNHHVNAFTNSIKSIKNKKLERGGVILVLGKDNISRDSIHLLGQQVPRVLCGKTPYPVMFLNENAKNEFKSSITSLCRITSSNNCESTDEIVGETLVRAAKIQINLSMEDAKLESFRKMYITGHSSSGMSYICSGDSKFSIKEIVDILEKNKILDNIKDIRLTCCNSADKREIKNLSQESIELANRDSSFWENLVYGEKKSLIEKLSSEIWERGYTDVRISGYHGKGVFYNKNELPLTHLRSSTIPATETVKRKYLRVTLESDLD